MAMSIGTKTIKGQRYYFARECKRVNGKPRIVWQKYLGKAERVVSALQAAAAPPEPEEVIVSEFGAVTALYDLATKLELVETIDRHTAKRRQGPTVGQYMLVAALNRCVCPKSKAAIGDWFESTALRRFVPVAKSQLTSKRFWDNMGHLTAESIRAIERELTERVVQRFAVDTRCLLFDCTNFFTFIDSFNDRSTLAQRGHSKEGRDNLRIIGLGLLASVDFHVPLFHEVYPGNRNDAREFESVTEQIVERYRALAGAVEDVTLVFDKGNNSADNVARLDASPLHFVGSLKANQCPELLDVPLDRYEPLHHASLYGVSALRKRYSVFGRERTVLVTYNEQLYLSQSQSLLAEIKKRTRHLNELGRQLGRRRAGEVTRGRKPTVASVRKEAEALLKGQYVRDLVRVEVTEREGLPELAYRIDDDALRSLCRKRFGKTLLFTDNDAWTNEQIVLAYRGQAGVEACFKTIKDPQFVSWSPMFHWTDDKVRVHAFYCVLALLLATLLQRELHRRKIDISIPAMLAELGAIREVALVYPPVGRPRPPVVKLAKLTPTQTRLLDALDLKRHLHHPS